MSKEKRLQKITNEQLSAVLTDSAIMLAHKGQGAASLLLIEARNRILRHTCAAQDILNERRRQIESEGWSEDHDDQHTDQSLALVAALYAAPVELFGAETDSNGRFFAFEDPWPTTWDESWDRRDDFSPRRRLVVAAALLIAEIERIDRMNARGEPQ